MFYKAQKPQPKVEHFIEELEGSILGGREWDEQFILKILQKSWTEYIVSVTDMSVIFTFSLKLSSASLCEFSLQI